MAPHSGCHQATSGSFDCSRQRDTHRCKDLSAAAFRARYINALQQGPEKFEEFASGLMNDPKTPRSVIDEYAQVDQAYKVFTKDPSLTNRQVTDIILATATDMGDKGWDGMTGAGLLNTAAALRAETKEGFTVMFTNLRINRDTRGSLVSVDVYGTVRGVFKEFTVEAGKGKHAARFTAVAGPYYEEADYRHIARLNVKDVLRGSDDWIPRIRVVDTQGQEYIAATPFILPQ